MEKHAMLINGACGGKEKDRSPPNPLSEARDGHVWRLVLCPHKHQSKIGSERAHHATEAMLRHPPVKTRRA
ncbi:MAG: hypothetical protein GY696_39555 [Gammaproteobacteria bacterium]|nr:hypothetical protein [Gammaproteobacteria bacterium]